MTAVRALLATHVPGPLYDKSLAWGARASAYREELAAARAAGLTPVLIELSNDLGLTEAEAICIDHHGPDAGKKNSALRQIFDLLRLPRELWTREWELISANDVGHIRGLVAAGATSEEIQQIRARDRAAQGITPEEEALGALAARQAVTMFGGRLTVTRVGHDRGATVLDSLAPELGGSGFQNLLILCREECFFQGEGSIILELNRRFPGGWCGGELPERGYWGYPGKILESLLWETLGAMLMTTKQSSEIDVLSYNLILTFPVLLQGNLEPHCQGTPTQRWTDYFCKQGWQDLRRGDFPGQGGANDISPVPQEFPYEEIVYFHPFVRDFLYGDGATRNQHLSVRTLTRGDVGYVKVTVAREKTWTLPVLRTQLYVMKPNVAVLAVEISNGEPLRGGTGTPPVKLTLSDVLELQDKLRRIYPPFWWDSDEKQLEATAAGLCPLQVEWLDAGQNVLPLRAPLRLGAPKRVFDEFTRAGAEPPVLAHWQFFFGDLPPLQCHPKSSVEQGDPSQAPPCFQQATDERIPSMSFLAVANTREISEGDFDRLTFVDPPGADSHPYDAVFLARNREEYNYDRFRHYGTRYLCSGYGFTVVGNYGLNKVGEEIVENNTFFREVIRRHFRHMYFRMGLIGHYCRAVLLSFGEELSDVIKGPRGKGPLEEMRDPLFRERIEEIQMQFAKFRSRSYFPEVSNQLQGRELYALWIKHLGIETQFELVDSTSERLHTLVTEREARTLSNAATVGVPLALGWGVAQTMLGLLGLTECKCFGVLAILGSLLATVLFWWLWWIQFPKNFWKVLERCYRRVLHWMQEDKKT